jgi:hypothetical protein
MDLRTARLALWLLPFALMTAAHAGAPPARVIEGIAVASSGPVADVEVRATTHEGRTVTGRTDAHGHFELRGLPDGGWTLTASRGAEQGELAVSAFDTDARNVVLELGPPRSVRGLVRGASGTPLNGVRVEAGLQGEFTLLQAREARGGVHVTQDGEWHLGRIQPDGTYRLRVPPGRGTLEVLNRQGEPVPFEGTEGQTVRVDLVAPGGN